MTCLNDCKSCPYARIVKIFKCPYVNRFGDVNRTCAFDCEHCMERKGYRIEYECYKKES